MKKNFSNEEASMVFNAFANGFSIRVNKAGNIDLVDLRRTNPCEHFVLYARPNGKCLWRRHFANGYCYPLNMKNRNKFDLYRHKWEDGSVSEYRYYNFGRHAEFNSVKEAVEYFKNYLKKFRGYDY